MSRSFLSSSLILGLLNLGLVVGCGGPTDSKTAVSTQRQALTKVAQHRKKQKPKYQTTLWPKDVRAQKRWEALMRRVDAAKCRAPRLKHLEQRLAIGSLTPDEYKKEKQSVVKACRDKFAEPTKPEPGDGLLPLSTSGEVAFLFWPWPDWYLAPPLFPPLLAPSMSSVADTAPVATPGSALVHDFAMAEIVLDNFWKCSPPEIRIYDDEAPGSEPYWVIKWNVPLYASEAGAPPWNCFDPPAYESNFKVMFPLVPDPVPGTRSGQTTPYAMAHVPHSRRTRIELWHASLGTFQTAYITLKAGVFVVPVQYHDVIEYTDTNYFAAFARMVNVIAAFWSKPSTSPDTGDINSIWHQADVQLQLTWAAWWVLGPAESSTLNIATCGLGWDPDDKFSVSNAVDLYGIRYLGGAAGYGACRVDGFVAVQSAWLDNPNSQHPLVDSRLIGHEFGHYLGGLGHSAGWDDLMLSSVGGSNVTPGQVQLMRSFISNRVDSNPATDYWKDR